MSEREVQLLLEDILEASQKILSYTSGMNFDNFRHDDKTIDSVVCLLKWHKLYLPYS